MNCPCSHLWQNPWFCIILSCLFKAITLVVSFSFCIIGFSLFTGSSVSVYNTVIFPIVKKKFSLTLLRPEASTPSLCSPLHQISWPYSVSSKPFLGVFINPFPKALESISPLKLFLLRSLNLLKLLVLKLLFIWPTKKHYTVHSSGSPFLPLPGCHPLMVFLPLLWLLLLTLLLVLPHLNTLYHVFYCFCVSQR